MYLCICHAVTLAEVRQATEAGVCDFDELVARFSLGDDDSCGTCLAVLEDLLVDISPPEKSSGKAEHSDACPGTRNRVACTVATAHGGTE